MDQISGATADAAGKDYFQGKVYALSNRARHIEAMGLVGGVAAGDSCVDIYSGGNFIGRIYNSTAGANKSFNYLTDLKPFDFVVGPGELVQCLLVTNAGTNRLEVAVDWSYVS